MTRIVLTAVFTLTPIAVIADSARSSAQVPPSTVTAPMPSSSDAFAPAPVPNVDLFPPEKSRSAGLQFVPSLATRSERSEAIGEAFVPGSKIQLPEDQKRPLAPGFNLKLPLQ